MFVASLSQDHTYSGYKKFFFSVSKPSKLSLGSEGETLLFLVAVSSLLIDSMGRILSLFTAV